MVRKVTAKLVPVPDPTAEADRAWFEAHPERRFRLTFAAGYAAMLVVAVLWADGAPPGPWSRPLHGRYGDRYTGMCVERLQFLRNSCEIWGG